MEDCFSRRAESSAEAPRNFFLPTTLISSYTPPGNMAKRFCTTLSKGFKWMVVYDEVFQKQIRLVIPYWRKVALAMLCMGLVAASSTACLYLIKPVFDDLIVKKNREM